MKFKQFFALACLIIGGGNLWAQTDVTSQYITNADFSSTEGWTQDHSSQYWSLGNGLIGTYAVANEKKSTTDATHLSTEYCLGVQCRWQTNYAAFTQTTSELPAGAYTLSFDVQNANASTSATYDNRFKVTVAGSTYTDSKTEWMSGSSLWTTHTIEFTISEAATATISLGYGTSSNNLGSGSTPHLYVSHLKLEVYPFATSSDYEALSTAISTVGGITWGFDAGEYAPYNYVEVIQALAAAQAIDPTANNSQATVQALTATLNTAMTANAAEVNAIWDPSFEHDYSGQSGNINPIGWQRVKDADADGYNVRLMNGSNAGLAATSSGKAIFTKQSAYYGYAEGYTMPLNANTYYTISFIYGGWGDCKSDGYISMADPEGNAVTLSSTDLPLAEIAADTKTSAWYPYSSFFKTGAAGDYALGLRKKNYDTSGQSQYVYGDFVLKTTTVDEATAYYNTVKDEVDDSYNADANGGSEKTAFKAAIDASAPSNVDEIMEAAANLYTLRDAFVAATPKYDAYLAEKTNAERIDASITSGVSAPTTAAEAETALQTILVNEYNYVASNFNADAAATYGITIDQWTGTATSGGNSDTPQTKSNEKWGETATTYYEQGQNGWGSNAWTLNYTKTVTLPANTYVMKVAVRASTGATATLKATIGGTTITESLPNVGNTGLGITTAGVASFNGEDVFANNDNGYGWQWRYLAFTLENDGEVTLQIDASANSAQQWCSFGDVAVVSNVSTAAMETAYNNFTMQTLGFENGQYAPYNNVAVLEAYAQAKAIVEGTAVPSTQAEVDAITTTLTSPTWTANDGDVDAIYNGSFAEANGTNPRGWTRVGNGWGQQVTNIEGEATGWYYNQNAELDYGTTGVYTMPLVANQLYKLTFKYCSQAGTSNKGMAVKVLNADNEGMASFNFPASGGEHVWFTATAYFQTGKAGDYVLGFTNTGNTFWTGVSLVKAEASETVLGAMPANYTYYQELTLDRTFASTDRWYTLCAPFAFSKDQFAEVKVLSSVAEVAGDVNMTFADADDTVAAGTPCLVKARNNGDGLTVTNVALDPSTTAQTKTVGDATKVNYIGTFTQVDLTAANSNAWVVSNNNLYNVNSEVTVGAYRAYFTVETASGVKALNFNFDAVDAIEAIDNGQLTLDNAEIFNLAGQRVNKAQRGIYIINGKKVLVK